MKQTLLKEKIKDYNETKKKKKKKKFKMTKMKPIPKVGD